MPERYKVVVVDDDRRHCDLFADVLTQAGFKTIKAGDGAEVLEILESQHVDMIVSDVQMPNVDGISLLKQVREQGNALPFILVTAFPAVRDAVSALKLGAVDYLEKPVDLEELQQAVFDALNIQKSHNPLLPEEALNGVIVKSPQMINLYSQALMVAKSESTVLITGESGTGKEVMANFIHRNSLRAEKPYIALNCAAMPKELIAAELFGHTKGAFTGATAARKGKFREADGGTLFLDEIGDMPIELQASLLRVLENGRFTPVGSDQEVEVNVRIIAATNKDLPNQVAEKSFREDLFYRLNVIAFELPQLSERIEEIVPLMKFYLKKSGSRKRLSPLTEQLLKSYIWPGNVRELANIAQRCAILAPTDVILPEHLPPQFAKNCIEDSNHNCVSMEEIEKQAIIDALKSTDGNRTKAAEVLKISRRSLLYKLKRYDIS